MSSSSLERADRVRSKRMKKAGFERTSMAGVSPRSALTYKYAQSRAELMSAFQLVYQSYVDVGLQLPNASRIRFTKYQLLPTTRVFVALRQSVAAPELPAQVVGTVSLVEDSPMGLPMDEIADFSVSLLRRAKQRLAEVVALAVQPDVRGINVTMGLFRLLGHYCRQRGITHLGVSVTPRHASFYRDTLLFEPCGEPTRYGKANGVEAQGHMLDFANWDASLERAYGHLEFDSNLAAFFRQGRERLLPTPADMDVATARYFLALDPALCESLSPADCAFLQQAHGQGLGVGGAQALHRADV